MILWRLKILIKTILSICFIRRAWLYRLGLLKKCDINDFDLIIRKFLVHEERILAVVNSDECLVEIGTGDSVATGMFYFLIGGGRSVLVDIEEPKVKSPIFYKSLAKKFSEGREGQIQRRLDDILRQTDFSSLCNVCNIEYYTRGLNDPNIRLYTQFDYIVSHSCLEHIPQREMTNLYHIHAFGLKTGGKFSHNIDLQDHLDYSINHLRLGSWFWENSVVQNAGFYVNRVSCSGWTSFFNRPPLSVSEIDVGRHTSFPIDFRRLSTEYRYRGVDDLLIRTMHVWGKKVCEASS